MKMRTKIGIILISIILILLINFIILNKTGVINKIINNSKQEDIKKEISYEVYHHINGNTKILVVAEDTENGIEKIIYPNNEMELYANGKTKVAFDYNTDITGKESLTFKAINTLGDIIEKTIAINDQFYLDMIDYNLVKETEAQKALTVNYKEGSEIKQYRIGDTPNWVNYTNTIRLDDYQILETLGNENREVNVSLRQIDKVGNEIIVESKLKYNIDENVTYKQEDTVIKGESILACVENNNLESGNYIFRVTGTTDGETQETIEYPVELYNYNENANYVTNNIGIIAGRTYTGMGKISSEKRMLILKYNGDLTINSGVTITPTGTNASINGATYLCTKKGMLIYCAGTLTNNGTITMTAKGTVNQAGENVYLYKNENNTYEYVPAIGGTGGSSVSGRSTGKNGENGIARRTGGGASGAAMNLSAKLTVSGKGTSGTSYSGGTGGGGADTQYGSVVAGPGDENGGKGGNAVYDNYFGAGGGAGNPGGKGEGHDRWGTWYGKQSGEDGQNGTGGLLIISANSIKNKGTIDSNGSNGGFGYHSGGGGSGAGSINIFYKSNVNRGTMTVFAGTGGKCIRDYGESSVSYRGGNGGTGSITIGNISTGTFVKD